MLLRKLESQTNSTDLRFLRGIQAVGVSASIGKDENNSSESDVKDSAEIQFVIILSEKFSS